MELFSLIFGALIGLLLNILIINLPKNNFSILMQDIISRQSFVVSSISSLLTLFLFLKLGFSSEFILFCLLSYGLIVLSFIDLKYKAVPDYLLLFVFIISFFATSLPFLDALQSALILSGGFVLLNFVLTFYIQNIKSRIKKDETLKTQEALGEGDIPIIASMAIILGIESALMAMFLAAIFAIIPAIYSNFMKKEIEIPFIPYLVLGFFVEYFSDLERFFKAFS